LETSARAAISSTDAPSKPRSAKTVRAISISCSRRSAAVIRLRAGFFAEAAIRALCQSIRRRPPELMSPGARAGP
jgi:hypothetical protein